MKSSRGSVENSSRATDLREPLATDFQLFAATNSTVNLAFSHHHQQSAQCHPADQQYGEANQSAGVILRVLVAALRRGDATTPTISSTAVSD